MKLDEFHPQPALITKETAVLRPRFPAVDAHNHLGLFGGGWDQKSPSELMAALDAAHVTQYVDLDGGWGEDVLQQRLDKFKQAAPDRYFVFGGVDWSAWPEQGDKFGEWAAARFRRQVAWGAAGLKIWKPFGLTVRDQHDQLVAVDDRRLDPLWETAAALQKPVLIHVADPAAFFEPITSRNERWEELQAHPDWHFPSPPFPAFKRIMNQLENLLQRQAKTTFIGAHVGCYAENLGWVSGVLQTCPNFYVDFSARLGELGRQPYSARRFFLAHADQILFGIDAGPSLETYRIYYRFLETDDEYFNYGPEEPPTQGRWRIYGIHLPEEVLQKVYATNARRLLNIPDEK